MICIFFFHHLNEDPSNLSSLIKSATSSFRDCGAIEATNNFLRLLEKSKRKHKNEMLLRRVTMWLSLRNYLPHQKRYAKGYIKHFSRIQWSTKSSVCLINQNTFRFSIIARNRDSKFKYIRYQEKIAEDERKIVIFLITGQQLLLYCVE